MVLCGRDTIMLFILFVCIDVFIGFCLDVTVIVVVNTRVICIVYLLIYLFLLLFVCLILDVSPSFIFIYFQS